MKIENIVSFEQTDEDAWTLVAFSDDGPDPDGHVSWTFSIHEAVRLYNLLRRSHVAEHAEAMEEALASFKAGEGPNGEPRGTWEDELNDPAELLREQADHWRKAQRENA